MAVWPVPKLGTELLENVEPIFDCLGTVFVTPRPGRVYNT